MNVLWHNNIYVHEVSHSASVRTLFNGAGKLQLDFENTFDSKLDCMS
jgi:hypothetical protein